MAVPGGTMETLADIPHHVWKSLPDGLRLSPSAVDQSRIGVWASRSIPKGKRFGPFVGEKKKRSQVSSNVYMWEVYFPARGWMCVDATDPRKGNWQRYVNWANSTQEQNLFPIEINRAIYYKVLRPIGPGDELLVWYNGEDNPEITAALEEERGSSLSKKNSPRAKRARRKLLEGARQAGLGAFRGPKQTGVTKPIVKEMWDTEEGANEEDERLSQSPGPSKGTRESSPMGRNGLSQAQFISAAMRGEAEEDDEEEDPGDLQQPLSLTQQCAQSATEAEPEERSEQPDLPLSHSSPVEEGPGSLQHDTETASSLPRAEPEADPDPDPDLEGDPHGEESHPCQHCERHFSTKQGLERHTHIHATANQQTHTFKCRYCGKSFGSQVGRRRHERRHENGPKNKGQRPGSLAGTATLLTPLGQAGGSSPDCGTVSGHYVVRGSPVPGGPMGSLEVVRKDPAAESDRPFIVDENGETKELHPCKYCNKAFGTHTNMRRHQRRIHERHLLPKGIRRKGMLLQESPSQQQLHHLPEQSPSVSPPLVYVPSADTEDEGDREEYLVDIANNISENLSLYIDGKILSTSSVSGCEVIEVDSSSAALFGLDAVVISPNQISQALKVDTRTCAVRQVSNLGQPMSKRRTSTPPLMPSLKMESETGSSSASSSSSTSSSSALLVGSVFPQSSDSLAFQKEKTIYLSPKLKQLLQTQTDSQKPAIALIAERHRLAPPLSVTSLPAASGRFKRRTASPSSSPQLSPALKANGCKNEAGVSSYTLKVPNLETLGLSPAWSLSSKEERDTLSPSGKNGCSWSASRTGGNSCNQQPLDLSSGISKRRDSFNKTPGEVVLDLSMSRKSTAESKGSPSLAQPPTKKKKPNTSMLEKVLMNEYAGLSPAEEEGSSPLGSPDSQYTAGSGTGTASHSPSSNLPSESAHPSPPSLTPFTMNPSSPCGSSLTSPTPPPPVLPTMPSPDCPTLISSLPVLSHKMSPRSIDQGEDEPVCVSNSTTAETMLAAVSNSYGDEEHINKPIDSNPDPLTRKAISSPSTEPSLVSDAVALSLSSTQSKPARTGNQSLLDVQVNQDLEPIITEGQEKSQCSELPVLSSVTESLLSASSTSPAAISDIPAPPAVSPPSLSSTVIKGDPQHSEQLADLVLSPSGTGSSPLSAAADKPSSLSEEEEGSPPELFSKSFVCNVCEDPFRAIKELSRHILEHAAEWPYKCEFCVQLFGNAPALLEHRTALHGVGRVFVCSVCSKEFAFLCNLQQHQKDLHPSQPCTHTAVENGKPRPQNYTDPARAKEESNPSSTVATGPESSPEVASSQGVSDVKKEEPDTNGKHEEDGLEDLTEELYTTIKIMASEGGKPKGPDVRLGINQHYPSFKPPPFPYHNRTAAGSVASATNFTTHNIPQTFSTAIRCTKCGKSFDNMPELHKHILACANASDKRRYTPKKNPIPLRQIVKPQNGSLSPASAANAGHNAFRRMGQPKRLNFNQEPLGKTKMSSLGKKKSQLVQKAIGQRNETAATVNKAPSQVKQEEPQEQEVHVCPHCSREFTYPASLSKHIAGSCPMKPVSKKAKKGAATEATPAVDKNMSLRRRTTDSEIQQPEPAEPVPKTLSKTRARNSGPGPAEAPQPVGKGKMAATQVCTKRPASFPAATVSLSKKSKKGKVQSLPPTPLPSESPSDSAPRPAAQTKQRMGKEVPPKKRAEVKSPPQQQSQVPPKKEGERFSLRARERAVGPVTRSLQMANTAAPVEVKTDDLSSQEPEETQEYLLK
ncbi:PR domain zinc finger protein 2 [Oncorhynchus mykiss]|uniref:PR domain containing 2, with ZNF domain b n=1 Tax=Oncorhynchus mykiss TaxID=8022 RepID=A0A8C7PUZ7_ONCMY|nr:PR domain zinc finger protein 2 [Oncorhynchus mykiss]